MDSECRVDGSCSVVDGVFLLRVFWGTTTFPSFIVARAIVLAQYGRPHDAISYIAEAIEVSEMH